MLVYEVNHECTWFESWNRAFQQMFDLKTKLFQRKVCIEFSSDSVN